VSKICESACGLKFVTENSLEEYRAESLLTKEPETIAWIDSEVQPRDLIFDIGANVGIYSCYASRARAARVYAVEPVLRNFVRLCENIELNELVGVTPLLMAFSETTAIETLFVPDDRTGGSGSQVGHSHDERGTSFDAVRRQQTLVFSVDGFRKAFAIPTPRHIKIDVDGNEAMIIRGMHSTMQSEEVRSILVELNLADGLTSSLISKIESYGFTRKNAYNQQTNHSRNRRRAAESNVAENVIFTRV
jgi:FkbM family methyltransferase